MDDAQQNQGHSMASDATFQKQNLANVAEEGSFILKQNKYFTHFQPLSCTHVQKTAKTMSPGRLSGIQSHLARFTNIEGCR